MDILPDGHLFGVFGPYRLEATQPNLQGKPIDQGLQTCRSNARSVIWAPRAMNMRQRERLHPRRRRRRRSRPLRPPPAVKQPGESVLVTCGTALGANK